MARENVGEAMAKPGEQRLAELYGRHADDAVRLAYFLTGDRDAAEDVAQDAFVRLFGRFHDLRSADSFEIYLRRTIVNLARDRFRRLKVERDHAARATATTGEQAQTGRVDDRDLLRRDLQRLPYRQRAALVLRFYAELTEQQTADVLECTIPAVKSLVKRAMATLRGERS